MKNHPSVKTNTHAVHRVGCKTSGWGSDSRRAYMAGAFACKPIIWASGKSSHSFPIQRQSHWRNKGSVCASFGVEPWRCFKQTWIKPASIQASWPLLCPSTITAKTNAAIARCSGYASMLSRNLMKYVWPPSFTRSTWHDYYPTRQNSIINFLFEYIYQTKKRFITN